MGNEVLLEHLARSPGQLTGEARSSHREQRLVGNLDGAQPAPAAGSRAQADIVVDTDPLQAQRRGQVQGDVGQLPVERGQQRRQYAAGERGKRRNTQRVAVEPWARVERVGEQAQRQSHAPREHPPRFGQHDLAAGAVEQLDIEPFLQGTDGMADGALGQVQLGRRFRETLVAGGGLECRNGSERWRARRHEEGLRSVCPC